MPDSRKRKTTKQKPRSKPTGETTVYEHVEVPSFDVCCDEIDAAVRVLNKASAHTGQAVKCNGHRGHIIKIHMSGPLDGMADVEMARGTVTVALNTLTPWDE